MNARFCLSSTIAAEHRTIGATGQYLQCLRGMRLALLVLLIGCRSKDPEHRAPPRAPTVSRAGSAATHARRPPTLPAAAFTWAVAEASNSAAAWTSVADSLAAELAACTTDCREVAYEVVLARNNAARIAAPLPPQGDD
jgi:hypothetical protein